MSSAPAQHRPPVPGGPKRRRRGRRHRSRTSRRQRSCQRRPQVRGATGPIHIAGAAIDDWLVQVVGIEFGWHLARRATVTGRSPGVARFSSFARQGSPSGRSRTRSTCGVGRCRHTPHTCMPPGCCPVGGVFPADGELRERVQDQHAVMRRCRERLNRRVRANTRGRQCERQRRQDVAGRIGSAAATQSLCTLPSQTKRQLGPSVRLPPRGIPRRGYRSRGPGSSSRGNSRCRSSGL